MRLERLSQSHLRLVLSERNLRALLSKLSMPDSACTIQMDDGSEMVSVSSESNDQHYVNRVPGHMHPVTEKDIS